MISLLYNGTHTRYLELLHDTPRGAIQYSDKIMIKYIQGDSDEFRQEEAETTRPRRHAGTGWLGDMQAQVRGAEARIRVSPFALSSCFEDSTKGIRGAQMPPLNRETARALSSVISCVGCTVRGAWLHAAGSCSYSLDADPEESRA